VTDPSAIEEVYSDADLRDMRRWVDAQGVDTSALSDDQVVDQVDAGYWGGAAAFVADGPR